MSRTPTAFPDTHAKVLTAQGRGAIAVIEISGPSAHAAALMGFQPATTIEGSRIPMGEIRYGSWRGPENKETSTSRESVIVVARSSERVEVHCHGGTAAVNAILADLNHIGLTTESPLHHGNSLHQGSSPLSTLDIVRSTNTRWTAALALAQHRGAMQQWAATTLKDLEYLSDSDALERLRASAQQLLHLEKAGTHLTCPWRLVVAGPPNVGKSTLLNRLLGYERAITFDQPGTTRDLVEAETAIREWPVRIVDTAGLRISPDEIEAAGIERATEALADADLVLAIVDITIGWTSEHTNLLNSCNGPVAVVYNKSDLLTGVRSDRASSSPIATTAFELSVSAESGDGIEMLFDAIEASLIPHSLRAGNYPPTTEPTQLPPIPVNPKQVRSLQQVVEATTWTVAVDALRELAIRS